MLSILKKIEYYTSSVGPIGPTNILNIVDPPTYMQ